MLKKILILIALCCLFFSSCIAEKKKQISKYDTDSRVIKENDIVRVLVRADGVPGMYVDKDGNSSGFYVELEQMVMDEMGQACEFYAYTDIQTAYTGISSGEYHTVLAVPNLESYKSIVYLSEVYETLHFTTFVQKGNSEIRGETREEVIRALFGKKVGVQARGHIYHALKEYKEIELVEFPTTTQALEALNKGAVDAVPDVERIVNYFNRAKNWNLVPVGEPVLSHKVSTGISRAYDESFVKKYNEALNKLLSDGRFARLYDSYFR